MFTKYRYYIPYSMGRLCSSIGRHRLQISKCYSGVTEPHPSKGKQVSVTKLATAATRAIGSDSTRITDERVQKGFQMIRHTVLLAASKPANTCRRRPPPPPPPPPQNLSGAIASKTHPAASAKEEGNTFMTYTTLPHLGSLHVLSTLSLRQC